MERLKQIKSIVNDFGISLSIMSKGIDMNISSFKARWYDRVQPYEFSESEITGMANFLKETIGSRINNL